MKITKTLFIGWEVASYLPEGGKYSVREHNPTWDTDFKLLTTQEVEFEVQEVDARGELIESLQRRNDAIWEKASKDSAPIKEKIQQLLALDAPAAA